MKKTYISLMLSIAVSVLAGEDKQSYVRRNTWSETVTVNSGISIPADFKRDFPAQSISFHNIYGWKYKGWPSIADLAGFEKVLRDNILQPQSRRFADELKELNAAARLAPEQKICSVLNLFEKILLSERMRFLKDLPPIAFIRRNGYGMTGTNGTMFSRRTDIGSALCILDPATGNVRTIFETTGGFILDIKPSYDAMKLVMSYKTAADQPFHIWEINIDGTGLRQITSGPYHDFNPVYYPDGRIIFSSSRVESYSLCQDFLACALYSVNQDGSNIRRFDFTTLCSNTANVMPDGSVICTRWEYQDKNIFSWQGLWTINPNGRQLKLYYGNTLTVPNSLYGPQPVPGSDKVMITMAAHHCPPVGDIAIVDRTLGVENPAGLKQITHATTYRITAGRDWRDCNWGPGDAYFGNAYVDPWPVSPEMSIVSLGDNGFNRHGLYILCHNGLVQPLYMHETQSCFSAVTLNKRAKPITIAGEVPATAGFGTFFVQDVYQGLTQQGVTNRAVKALRVIRPTPKKWNTEGPRFHDHYPVVGYGSYYIKENLGTVPVYEDGTAYFIAPSSCELYFIALDGDGKEIQRMGSVTQITTDEHVSCIGCHEDKMKVPVVDPNAFKRLSRQPDRIIPPPEGAGPFDYVKHVQPVLDRYCLKCHSGRNPKSGLDLSGDKTRFFNMSYDHLIDHGQVEYYFINPGPTGVFPAMKTGSMVSKLTKLIENNHNKINMDDQSRRAIYAWIDSNVQYYNTWDMSRPHTTGGRDTWQEPWIGAFSAVYDKNCLSCHGALYNKNGGSGMDPKNRWINLTNPQNSRMLNAHLSSSAGGIGLALQKNNTNSPVFKDTGDQLYQAMLKAIEQGRDALLAKPRMDMPGAQAIPQERNFGRVF